MWVQTENMHAQYIHIGEIVEGLYFKHARFALWMTLRCKTWQEHLQKLCMTAVAIECMYRPI